MGILLSFELLLFYSSVVVCLLAHQLESGAITRQRVSKGLTSQLNSKFSSAAVWVALFWLKVQSTFKGINQDTILQDSRGYQPKNVFWAFQLPHKKYTKTYFKLKTLGGRLQTESGLCWRRYVIYKWQQ